MNINLFNSYKHNNNQLLHLFDKYKLTNLYPTLQDLISKNHIVYDENLYSILHKKFVNNCLDSHLNESNPTCINAYDESYKASSTYQIMKQLFKKYQKKHNIHTLKTDTYLDIGSGTGFTSKYIGTKLNSTKILCIDIPNSEFDSEPNSKCEFQTYDGTNIPYAPQTVDLVTLFMVCHHVKQNEIDILLRNIHKILTPNGMLVIKEHNASHHIVPLINVQHDLLLTVGKGISYGSNDAPKDRHYYTIDSLKHVLKTNGFKLQELYTFNNDTKYYFALYTKN